MATKTNARSKSTPRKSTPRKVTTVPFASVKVSYITHRNIDPGTEKAANAMKACRQFIRDNRALLIKAGWDLSSHVKSAPYPDVPVKVAEIIVNRDSAALKALA
jgi:hypothetical protein